MNLFLFRWLNSWAYIPTISSLIKFGAVYLLYLMVVGLLLFAAATFFSKLRKYKKRNIELVVEALVSSLIARFVVVELIRFFYRHPRPSVALENVRLVIDHVKSASFPSGHTTFAFALATTVALYYPKTSILFFIAAFAVGIGRVAAGVHWPLDIIGGATVGILFSLLLRFLQNRYLKTRNQ